MSQANTELAVIGIGLLAAAVLAVTFLTRPCCVQDSKICDTPRRHRKRKCGDYSSSSSSSSDENEEAPTCTPRRFVLRFGGGSSASPSPPEYVIQSVSPGTITPPPPGSKGAPLAPIETYLIPTSTLTFTVSANALAGNTSSPPLLLNIRNDGNGNDQGFGIKGGGYIPTDNEIDDAHFVQLDLTNVLMHLVLGSQIGVYITSANVAPPENWALYSSPTAGVRGTLLATGVGMGTNWYYFSPTQLTGPFLSLTAAMSGTSPFTADVLLGGVDINVCL